MNNSPENIGIVTSGRSWAICFDKYICVRQYAVHRIASRVPTLSSSAKKKRNRYQKWDLFRSIIQPIMLGVRVFSNHTPENYFRWIIIEWSFTWGSRSECALDELDLFLWSTCTWRANKCDDAQWANSGNTIARDENIFYVFISVAAKRNVHFTAASGNVFLYFVFLVSSSYLRRTIAIITAYRPVCGEGTFRNCVPKKTAEQCGAVIIRDHLHYQII